LDNIYLSYSLNNFYKYKIATDLSFDIKLQIKSGLIKTYFCLGFKI